MVLDSPSLDSYKHNCNKVCSKRAAVGPVEINGKKMVGYARLYCKSWTCRYCGPRKAKELAESIGSRAKEHGLSRFLTLTLDPKIAPTKEHIKYIREVWRKFRVYLKREFGRTVSFIAVMELHKSGYPHLHVLVDQYIHHGWISKNWNRLGGGKIVFIKRVRDLKEIGWYLGKYLTKDVILSTPNGTRRVTTSQDIKLRGPGPPSGWKLAKFTMDTLYRAGKNKIVKEAKDENENVKMFVVKSEIEDVASVEIDKGKEG